jgi:HEAT repeat protein
MTSDYEKSENCQLELQYARKQHKRIIPCMLADTEIWKPSDWLELTIRGLECIDFHDVSDSSLLCNVIDVIYRIKKQSPVVEYERFQPDDKPSYLFELIKYEYKRTSRIARLMNPAIAFPIEKSYINLAIIEAQEQQEKEKKLRDTPNSDAIMGTFEDIYSNKTPINVKNIFTKCKDQTKKVLVLGRAGIGKSTFCRYAAHQWGTGAIWPEYELVVLIPLRSLTENRYPPGTSYTPIDIVRKQYFSYPPLSEKDETFLREQLGKSRVLWLLDGYDEIVQNLPTNLESLLEQLLKTPHHILTSRPYLNTLSYNVQLEITGFTDHNITKYVKQFFDQIKDEIDNASREAKRILDFLKSNPRIWGIVHIPVNLELMCSLWCNPNWSETTTLTMTTVYNKMIEWLCRRHLKKQNISSYLMTKADVYAHFQKELGFLESFAFNGMENKSIILPPKLLVKALKQSACSLQHQPHLLNIGILKPLDYQPIGTCIEADKNHYFIHLSFQEHFAARYLVKALNGAADQKKEAIDFIKTHKYNQRFELVLIFVSGLLVDNDDEQCMDLFWKALLEEPLDLIGMRHVQMVISCLEEAGCSTTIPHYPESINLIIKWITHFVSAKHNNSDHFLSVALQRSPSLVNQPEILDTFIKLYQDRDPNIRSSVLSFISKLLISNPSSYLIPLYLPALQDENHLVRWYACGALWNMGEKAATNEVINRLLLLLSDANHSVRSSACEALWNMGEKAATNEVINRLLILLGDTNDSVRSSACAALGKMGEKAATNEVINRLLILLGDTNHSLRWSACEVLGKMGEKAATNEVIKRLLLLLDDTNDSVRSSAYEALGKMGEKAATNEVINRLLILLGDTNDSVRSSACEVLGEMGEKAATNEVINRLLLLLGDTDDWVSRKAYKALGKMGEKAATNEVINRLLILLGDTNDRVRCSACAALG